MLCLVQDKTPLASIQIRDQATESEQFAAQQLQHYVEKITETRLPISVGLAESNALRIVVAELGGFHPGESLPTDLSEGLVDDGYRITCRDNTIFIVSKDPGGLVHGVYQYLRHACGCRFYDLGERGETIPRTPALSHAPLEKTDNPACWYRALQVNAHEEPENILLPRLDWMAKNGYRHVLIHYNKVKGVADKSPETPWGKYRAWLMPELRRRGLRYTLGHHNFSYLVPSADYLEKRPDFFALSKGIRKPVGQLQFCLSNEDLIATVAARLGEVIDANPDADTLALWPDDGVGDLCECENCRALDNPHDHESTHSHSLYGAEVDGEPNIGRRGERHRWRRYLHLCNRVARHLEEKYPHVKLSTIAYVDFVDPPLRDVTIHKNIVVHLALYWRCSKHFLSDKNCPVNRQFADIIRDWLTVLPARQLLLTTYEAGMSAWKCLPFPIAGKLTEEWEQHKAMGIGGVKSNAMTLHWGVFGLNYVALSNALRAEPMPFDELLNDYCRSLFGEAGPCVKKVFELWEQCLTNADAACITPSPFEFLKDIFTPDCMDRSEALLREALPRCRTPDEIRRMNRLFIILEYVQINRSAPSEPIIKFLRTREKDAEHADAVEEWLRRDGQFVAKHLDPENYLFPKNFAEQMRTSWLMQV